MKQSKTIYDDYKKLSDEELVYRYVQRNEYVAIYHLFERYGHLVFGICVRYVGIDATKCTQELFINLLTDLKRYKVAEFKPWLYQYVKNFCATKANGSIAISGNVVVNDTDGTFEKPLIIETETMLNLLVGKLQQLDADRRHCIELFYAKKLNYAAIAAKTGFTYDKVKNLVRSGKRELKTKLLEASGTKES